MCVHQVPTFLFILQTVLANVLAPLHSRHASTTTHRAGDGANQQSSSRTHCCHVVILVLILALAVGVPDLPAIMTYVRQPCTQPRASPQLKPATAWCVVCGDILTA